MKFYVAETQKKAKFQSLCKKIAEDHQGWISVKSESDKAKPSMFIFHAVLFFALLKLTL